MSHAQSTASVLNPIKPNPKPVVPHQPHCASTPVESLDLHALIRPETPFEERLLHLPAIRRGLKWGQPRFGHPEGKVGLHVREVLDNLDRMDLCPDTRALLRIVAIVHDAFKWQEPRTVPRDWNHHHGRLARRFLEPLLDDRLVLDLVEWHDEGWYIWRYLFVEEKPWVAQHRLDALIRRFGAQIQTYYLFFKADTCTGDKLRSPLEWFEQAIPGLRIVTLPGADVRQRV